MIHYMPLLFSETKIQELSSASNISVWENTLLREDPPVDTIKLFNSSSGNMFPQEWSIFGPNFEFIQILVFHWRVLKRIYKFYNMKKIRREMGFLLGCTLFCGHFMPRSFSPIWHFYFIKTIDFNLLCNPGCNCR